MRISDWSSDVCSSDLLGEYGERYPSQLSGGQQQRVALARALVAEPHVILFDEPLSNLDAQLRDSMRTLLQQIHGEFGITAVYVTHDQTRSEEHTSELQSLMRISYAVFCLNKKKTKT